MSSNYKIQTDLKEATSMANGLSDYVRSEELYGNGEGGFFSKMPSLTVGALLMRLRRLQALRGSMNEAQQRELDSTLEIWRSTRKEWRVHYENKLVRELDSRADSMKTFFKECAESPMNCRNNYRPELLKRTIIQELLHEIDELNISDDVATKVSMVDNKLHQYMRADEFQWAEQLKTVYPKDEFWWLYQKPPQSVTEK